jgi:hypothetical protein
MPTFKKLASVWEKVTKTDANFCGVVAKTDANFLKVGIRYCIETGFPTEMTSF